VKKIVILIVLITNLSVKAQCPSPSNLSASSLLSQTTLSWTENGTATSWEIAVVPNYTIGDPIPTSGVFATSNPYVLTNLPPVCNAFFVRSVCSSGIVSPWTVIGEGCSLNTYNWLLTLSDENFIANLENKSLMVFPNPAKNVIYIKSNSEIEKITIFDYSGKEVLTQIQNNNEVDVENLSNGIYLIEIYSENEKVYRKFIKNK
jgi:hypothetical protein